MRRVRRIGMAANRAAEGIAARVDTASPQVTSRLAGMLSLAVTVLRFPSLALWVIVWPFIALTLAIAASGSGGLRVLGLVVGLAMAAVSVAFGLRRRALLAAVADREAFAAELHTALNLTHLVGNATGALERLAAGGGWRLFSRLRAAWRTVTLPVHWIDEIAALPRARYFVPPKLGTTVALIYAALWLVPVALIVAILTTVIAIARLV